MCKIAPNVIVLFYNSAKQASHKSVRMPGRCDGDRHAQTEITESPKRGTSTGLKRNKVSEQTRGGGQKRTRKRKLFEALWEKEKKK